MVPSGRPSRTCGSGGIFHPGLAFPRRIGRRTSIPRAHQRRWRDFTSRCALFQPPREDLLGFYLSCGAGPWLGLPEGWEIARDQELVAMTEAPIEHVRDADPLES